MSNNVERRIRIESINPFISSNSKIKWKKLFLVYIILFELCLVTFSTLSYNLITHNNLNIFESINAAGGDFFKIQMFVVRSWVDNIVIDTYNAYVKDLTFVSFEIPKIINFLNYNNFKLSLEGYILIFLSVIVSLLFLSIFILQLKDQKKYANRGLHSIYSPFLTILFSRFFKNYHFYSRVETIRKENFSVDTKIKFIEMFFKNDDLYKTNNVEDLELHEETIMLFWDLFIIIRVSLKVKQKKSYKK